jgi:lysophospholipase L1-like esterase
MMRLFSQITERLRMTGAAIALSLIVAGTCHAAQFKGHFYSFGDSYTDLFGILPLTNNPTKYIAKENHWFPLLREYYPISNALFEQLNPSFERKTNADAPFSSYGQSGARVVGAGGRWLFKNQVDQAIGDLKATKFADDDVVFINIGINDAGASGGAWFPKLKDMVDNGTIAAKNATDEVEKLVGKGAKNIIFSAFSSYAYVNETLDKQNAIQADVFAAAYFAGLQKNLPRLTDKGTRIFLVDINQFFEKIRQKPADFGFNCYRTCKNWNTDKRAMWDNLHPSTEGFALYAKAIASFYDNPQTIPDFGTLILDSGHVTGKTYYNFGNLIIYRKQQTALSATFTEDGNVTLVGPADISVDAKNAEIAPTPSRNGVIHIP